MLKKLFLIGLFIFLIQCSKNKKIEVKFLNEFVLADSLYIDGLKIGGISDITFTNDTLFMAIDDDVHPRILKAKLRLENQRLISINVINQIHIKNDSLIFKNPFFDIEGIFVTNNNQIFLTSEGNINQQKQPFVCSIFPNGKVKNVQKLPNYLSDVKNHYHNKSFEATCLSIDKKGFWLATEAPLQIDGEPSNFEEKEYPIRLSYFDFKLQKVTKQFVYLLEPIKNKVKSDVSINGLTSILQISEFQFIAVERLHQSGLGSYGNQVQLYLLTIDKNSTNTIAFASLKQVSYQPIQKQLLFDFNNIKSQLTEGIIDNLEGISFGPKLANGNQSLLIASDDNFQVYGKQLNQFILFELIVPKS